MLGENWISFLLSMPVSLTFKSVKTVSTVKTVHHVYVYHSQFLNYKVVSVSLCLKALLLAVPSRENLHETLPCQSNLIGLTRLFKKKKPSQSL